MKIDQCFISDVLNESTDSHIITTIIDLAHHLGRTVVAEGVETIEQSHFLAGAGCELAQGYLYSEPIDETKVNSILNTMEKDGNWPIGPVSKLRQVASK